MSSAGQITRGLKIGLCLTLLHAAMVLLVMAPGSIAQAEATSQPATQPVDPQVLSQSISELASSDATVRELAQLRLMNLNRADLPALRATMEKAFPLAPSQAACLRQIVREVYLAGEEYEKEPSKGFLGILMERSLSTVDFQQPNENGQPPGVIVEDRIPGFCASRLLRDGDMILGTIDPAQTFRTAADLISAIGGLDPGARVRLRVVRQGQIIEVALTLDSRPVDAEITDAELFRNRREKKFDDYWGKTFAPLLKEALASN
jgi:hypothetical protein